MWKWFWLTLIDTLDVQCVWVMTSSNRNIFRVTGPLCGEFIGHRWIPRTKASDVQLWCFFFICHWTNGWVNNREAGGLRRHRAHYDVIVLRGTPGTHFNYSLWDHNSKLAKIMFAFKMIQNVPSWSLPNLEYENVANWSLCFIFIYLVKFMQIMDAV